MIPTIGIMIGAYIIVRAFELIARRKDSFSSPANAIFIRFCAVALIVVTSFCILNLLLTGASFLKWPSGLPGETKTEPSPPEKPSETAKRSAFNAAIRQLRADHPELSNQISKAPYQSEWVSLSGDDYMVVIFIGGDTFTCKGGTVMSCSKGSC